MLNSQAMLVLGPVLVRVLGLCSQAAGTEAAQAPMQAEVEAVCSAKAQAVSQACRSALTKQ